MIENSWFVSPRPRGGRARLPIFGAFALSVALAIAILGVSGCATTHPRVSPKTAPTTRPTATSPCDAPPAKTGNDPARDYLDIETCPVEPSPNEAKPHAPKSGETKHAPKGVSTSSDGASGRRSS